MNILSRLGPLGTAAVLLLAKQGATQSVPSPNLDLSSLGQVALAGDFDAIQTYSFAGQHQGFTSNGSTSLLSHLPDGAYEALSYSDGSIEAICPFVLRDGTFVGIIVGGNFTSIGGVASRSAALFNTITNTILGHPGIEGQVSALYCDQDSQTVYLGGAFEAAGSSNAIAWTARGAWANLPFAGFDAPVTSISKAPNGNIVFGGSFTGLGNLSSSSNSTERANQPINLGSANITSGGTTTRANFDQPESILCPSNATDDSSSWLLRNNEAGFWRAAFGFGFQPTKLRLWNTNREGRGTRTWRFTALPLQGIMNFTYTDTETGDDAYCDALCPLAQNSSTGYQDFFFVDPNVGMNAFRIDISDWYGEGGGLDGIQLFQSDIFSYAINDFNQPSCEGTGVVSSATATGAWYEVPSYESTLNYLTVVTGPTTVEDTEIVFSPNILETGNYSVIVYTPGCIVDSSCSARAIVNVSGTLTTDADPSFSTQVFQTNNFDKYDQVYQGRIDATTDSFRPQVTIRASLLQTDQLVVASKVRFGYISSSGGLNGLYEYDPNQALVDMDFSNSAINNAGTLLQPDANILTLATNGETIFAAGSFSDTTFENIMAFSDTNASSLPGSGLNSVVSDLYSQDDFLYVGGNFTRTSSGESPALNHAAAYQYSTDEWIALGAGVNGPVDYVIPVAMNISATETENMIAFTGRFSQILAFGSTPAIDVEGLAIWSTSSQSWLQQIPGMTMQLLCGKLTAATFLPNETWMGAGTLASLGQGISGVVGMSEDDGQVSLQKLPIEINPSESQRPLQKRALTGSRNVTGVVTGTYDQTNGRNLSIFGGRFSATASNGSTIENLLFSNGSDSDTVTGLPPGIDSNSTFLALTVQSGILFAGGSVTGRVGDTNVNGVVLYDLASASYRSVQPASLEGDNVIVNAIAAQPDTSSVYVGGSFDSTSQGLSCSCVCMYDTSTSQWNSAGSGLEGEVRTLYWSSGNTLLAAGNLSVSGNATSLATYDADDQTWSVISVAGIPEGVTVFAQATNNANQMWVAGTATNGSAFVVKIDNNDNVRPVTGLLGDNTTIRGLQVMSLNQNHAQTDYLGRRDALLVTGQLNLTDFGMASAALFNGTSMNPLILASKADGSAGSISQLISSVPNDRGSSRRGRSTGIVVLVALCAALGTIFLIILLGILLNRIQRRRAGYSAIPSVAYADKNSNINRVPPERLFGSLGQRQGPPHV